MPCPRKNGKCSAAGSGRGTASRRRFNPHGYVWRPLSVWKQEGGRLVRGGGGGAGGGLGNTGSDFGEAGGREGGGPAGREQPSLTKRVGRSAAL